MEALAAWKNQGNGAHDPASAGTPYVREMGGTAPCPLRSFCGAHRIHAGHPGKEALDLLGDSRFRTLRQHCLVYESLWNKGFTVIPWQERHVRSLPQPARRRGGHPTLSLGDGSHPFLEDLLENIREILALTFVPAP